MATSRSINQGTNAMPGRLLGMELEQLLNAILADLAALRTQMNTHVHSGITAGGANTAVATTTSPTLNLLA
jgi:hypothetical protein